MSNLNNEIEEIEDSDEFSTVFSDLMSFVAAMFILLFTLVYHKEANDDLYFIKMSMRFGGVKTEQSKRITSDSLFVSNLHGYVQDQDLSQYALILAEDYRVRLILNDAVLFDEDSAVLKPSGKRALDGFSEVVKGLKNDIVIEGHSDASPLHVIDSNQNWNMSMARAYTVLRYMIDQGGVPPKQLSLQAYGPYQPLAPNNTKANRAKNRRVEINLIRLKSATKPNQSSDGPS